MDGTDDRLRSPRSQRPTAAGGEYSSGPAHATVPMFRWADTDGSSEDEFSLRDTSSSDEGEMALLAGDANVTETDAAGHESPWADGAVAASLGSPRPPESVPAAAPAAERSMRRALSANDVARVAEATDRDALLESDGGAVGAADRHSIELGAAPWARALHTSSASAWATPGAVQAAPPLTLPPWAMRVDDGAACTAPVSATADSFARPERASSSESLALALTLDDVGGRRSKSGFIPMLERTPTPPPPTSPLLRRMHSEGDLALAGGAAAESAVPETTGPLLKKPKRPLNALLCFLFDRLGNVQLTTVLSSEILLTARTLEEEERSAHLARAVEDASGAADTTNAATTSLPASTSPAAAAPNGARHPKRKQRKGQRVRLHGLVRARDIRYVHPSMRAKPVVMVRRHLFIMCFEHIRAIVLADRLFLFDPGNPRVQASARAVEDRLAVAKLDASTYAPFELRALEALLIEVADRDHPQDQRSAAGEPDGHETAAEQLCGPCSRRASRPAGPAARGRGHGAHVPHRAAPAPGGGSFAGPPRGGGDRARVVSARGGSPGEPRRPARRRHRRHRGHGRPTTGHHAQPPAAARPDAHHSDDGVCRWRPGESLV
eukprot:ctg_2040.g318